MNKLVSADIEAYAQAHSMPESDLCRALREETQRRMESPQMIVGPLEGAFLKMMTQLVQATSVLEIGMFTGYSALCFAEALPADGTVLTCELMRSQPHSRAGISRDRRSGRRSRSAWGRRSRQCDISRDRLI